MDNIKLGVVGVGYVGKACIEFFSEQYQVFSYDINNSGSEKSLTNLILKSDIIFICLPTPMNDDGSCNTSIIESVLFDINNQQKKSICVIKSTIPPGTSSNFSRKFSNIEICFNPEFLTEANYIEDFKNQSRIIIGGKDSGDTVVKLFTHSFPNAEVIKCKFEEAEMVKYFTNSFLATKVAFANEYYSLCKKMGIDYNKVSSIAMLDTRIGKSHFSVPGPDGAFGFGGSCFPKDLNSIINTFKRNNIHSYVLNSVWERNIEEDRTDQDWNELKGRVVSE